MAEQTPDGRAAERAQRFADHQGATTRSAYLCESGQRLCPQHATGDVDPVTAADMTSGPPRLVDAEGDIIATEWRRRWAELSPLARAWCHIWETSRADLEEHLELFGADPSRVEEAGAEVAEMFPEWFAEGAPAPDSLFPTSPLPVALVLLDPDPGPPWRFPFSDAPRLRPDGHTDYPHDPGTLPGCPACESMPGGDRS